MNAKTEIAAIAIVIGFFAIVIAIPDTPQPQVAQGALDEVPSSSEGAPETVWQQEDDPFRRCAMKALAGEFGELAMWQRCAYEWGLARGVTADGLAKVTSYGYRWENEPGQNHITASGSHVHRGGCAANPELPFGTIIWTPYGLRYVTDRGGAVKLSYTNSREIANLDYYTWTPRPTLRNAPFAVVKRRGDKSVWHRQREF